MKSKYIIHTFQIKKGFILSKVNIIKNNLDNQISILIETDSNNDYYSYSTKINENNILNTGNQLQLNFLDYFYKDKASIKEINDSEIIINIIIDDNNYIIKKDSKEFNFITIKEEENVINMSIKIKRNEYYILWRDSNFESKNEYTKSLEGGKLFCIGEINMVVHCINSTEKALKFILKRINDKIIFIANIGKDLAGKRYIEIVRRIYGFNIIVLFYSYNRNHFSWIFLIVFMMKKI